MMMKYINETKLIEKLDDFDWKIKQLTEAIQDTDTNLERIEKKSEQSIDFLCRDSLGYTQKDIPKPEEEPKAEFELKQTEGITARIYCNLHGAWRS